MERMVMTVPEVAQLLHVHPVTIYRLLRAKKIPAFKIGGEWRFNRESITAWQQQQEGYYVRPNQRHARN
jgi:excisionase family DNA binding protein